MDFKTIAQLSTDDALKQLGSSLQGLTTAQVIQKQKQFGFNRLEEKKVSIFTIFLRQFKSPFLYLLFFATFISFILGNFIEGSIILVFILINVSIGFFQEFKAEKMLQYLNQYLSIKNEVIRNGQQITVQSTELVPGDIVLLEPGAIIPADVRFIKITNFTINESIITGESTPVAKSVDPIKNSNERHQAKNIGFAGTSIASGMAEAVVFETGNNTSMQSIAALSTQISRESNFHHEIQKFSRFILNVVIISMILVFLINIILKGSSVNILELLIFSVALSVAITPEPLPLIIIFSLTRAAYHLAKSKVVVKRLSAIEDLGAINILCSDKTGTLTENKLVVNNVFTAQHSPEEVLLYSLLGSSVFSTQKIEASPFDAALWHKLGNKDLSSYALIHSIPFDPSRLSTSTLIKKNGQQELLIRGAAEKLKSICTNTDSQLDNWIEQEEIAGNRVLMIVTKPFDKSIYEVADEHDMNLIGAVSFIDPIKKDAIQAIQHANQLDVKLKILTGDSPTVAGAVAYQIGLIDSPKKVITGEAFDALPEKEKINAVHSYHVFARVNPEQKYTIISLLQLNNRVGYLGEGINDAPALKIAHVGIVVDKASDIAREAADIILLKKSLNIIITGIYYGRKIFENTIKYIKITLASNFGNFYSVSIASFFINFLPMLPTQILLVNLLSDLPMVSLSTDSVDKILLKNPKQMSINQIAGITLFLGFISSIFDFILFKSYYLSTPAVLQTNWFILSILTEIALIFSLRTRKPFYKGSIPSIPVIILAVACSCLTIIIPMTRLGEYLFDFIAPHMVTILYIIFLTILYFILTEIMKLLYYRLIEPTPK